MEWRKHWPETMRDLPLWFESEATIFLATINLWSFTVCALTQTMCTRGHTRIDALYPHDMRQTSYASYFASIFSLHNIIDPQIPKTNGNGVSANYTYVYYRWEVSKYLICGIDIILGTVPQFTAIYGSLDLWWIHAGAQFHLSLWESNFIETNTFADDLMREIDSHTGMLEKCLENRFCDSRWFWGPTMPIFLLILSGWWRHLLPLLTFPPEKKKILEDQF